jgi:hypothetical protein
LISDPRWRRLLCHEHRLEVVDDTINHGEIREEKAMTFIVPPHFGQTMGSTS